MTNTEKEKAYSNPFTLHRYVGFEGKGCSQFHTDNRKRVLAECAWVWDTRQKTFIKRPKESVN